MKYKSAEETELSIVGVVFTIVFITIIVGMGFTLLLIGQQAIVDIVGCAKYVSILDWVPWIHVC